jgi:hypothetical protein
MRGPVVPFTGGQEENEFGLEPSEMAGEGSIKVLVEKQ